MKNIKLTIGASLIILVISTLIIYNNNNKAKQIIDAQISFEELIQLDIKRERSNNLISHDIVRKDINDLRREIYIVEEDYFENGNDFHGVRVLIYERNSIEEPFTYSRYAGITSKNKPYNDLLDFVKNNNVFDYTDKQLTDMFGSASLESGYYLGQPLNDITSGLPAIVWRHWSPNYKNLIYIYQNEYKSGKGWSTRTFIENGDEDLWLYETVPFSYFPTFYEDYSKYDPIVFINDSEFYYITQPNFTAERKENEASEKLKNMSAEDRDKIGFGVYVYNIDTDESRLIEALPESSRKYKYITYKNNLYVYGGNLEVVKKYNSNGEFEKDIEFLNKDPEKNYAVLNFTFWAGGENGMEYNGKMYQTAVIENTSVGDFVEGLLAPLEVLE